MNLAAGNAQKTQKRRAALVGKGAKKAFVSGFMADTLFLRDWGVACAKRRAECLIKLVSKTVPNLSTASGGGRLATDYNKFTRRCRVVAHSARRSAASYFGPTGLPGQAGGAQAGQPGLAHSPLFTHTGSGDTTRPGHVADDYNLPVPPQAGPAPRPDGEDVTLDPDL